jgi:hypothetical protein
LSAAFWANYLDIQSFNDLPPNLIAFSASLTSACIMQSVCQKPQQGMSPSRPIKVYA